VPRAESARRQRLSRELLITTALRVADAEGLDALSMRRLGAELGVDPTAAYRHLPDKKALLAGVVEAVLAGADVETDAAAPWQDQFRAVARAYRDALLAHGPAVSRLAATLPLDSLESLRIVEHGAAILAAAGVPLGEAVTAIQAVGQLTAGSVLLEAFWREWAASGGEIKLAPPMLPHPELPVLSRAAAEADFLTPGEVFESGLEAVLGRLEPLAGRPSDAGVPHTTSDNERSLR
jgi:TetR/AcrR family transcriptional regulator, tetracycline repressor protein